MSGKYDDIIHLPHHVSKARARMSMIDRAAQFSPFAALTGYEAAIQETGRLTDARLERSEERDAALDRGIRLILEHLEDQPWVRVTRFVQDLRKSGGAYITAECRIRKVDLYRMELLTTEYETIPLDDIWELELL